MYKLDDLFSDTDKDNEKCYVDVAVMQGKAFDNHVSRPFPRDCLYNKDMVNPNLLRVITNNNYFDKYAGSTLLLVWSLYKKPLPRTEKGKMLLLCVDSAYKGFYDDDYAETQRSYLVDMLGFSELYKVILAHKPEDFIQLIQEYHLDGKIWYEDRKLKTDIDITRIGLNLELPLSGYEQLGEFVPREKYEAYFENYAACMDLWFWYPQKRKEIFSFAFTRKDKVSYSKVLSQENEKEKETA